MAQKNSEIIKTEILRVLNENGKTRSQDLVKRVVTKVGNEKTIYREISELVAAGEIDKKIQSRSYIEYEIINLHETVSNQLKDLFREISIVNQKIISFESSFETEKYSYHIRLRSVIHFIQIIQSTSGIMKMLSIYPNFKKDKMFSQINRKIEDSWKEIMKIIVHQPEEEFLNKILKNLRVSSMNSENRN